MKLIKESLDPWDENLMEKMLDEFEKEIPLDTYSWEQIQDIKLALWIGYNFDKIN